MAYNLVLESVCINEIAEHIDFLEAQRQDLGGEFYDELYEHLLFIERNPEVYQIQQDNLRRGLLSRFNYHIWYEIIANDVRVLSVVHGHSGKTDFRR